MQAEPDHEEDYASSEDSDFAPDDARPADESSASGDEDEGEADRDGKPPASRKRKEQATDFSEDAGFENSGDEAITEKGTKKRRKKKGDHDRGDFQADGEDGGEGGPVKTRSMRATEQAERRTATVNGPVTVDVDALWAQMMSSSAAPALSEVDDVAQKETASKIEQAIAEPASRQGLQAADGTAPLEPSDEIRIKRTYNFAGKIHTEEKVVARDSAEAKLYLASLGQKGDPGAAPQEPEPKRMPRKAFRSAFEPITEQMLQRADLDLGLAGRLRARELANQANAKKLNTVEKSRMDWAGYVDKEGFKDELELAGKSKDSFAARQDFLARTEARREDDARRVRLAERA